ncbi:lysozyme-like domain protein [TM7 phage DolZOral124_53_65]|nr:lysozyme-like domain protein [TM7 phage DolZOral124_53_65]
MFKQKNENMNVIYRADEATRRAIDALYVSKISSAKMMLMVAIMSMFVGVGTGWFLTVSHTLSPRRENIVKVEVAEPLKNQAQSDKK